MVRMRDFLPLPCDADRVAVASSLSRARRFHTRHPPSEGEELPVVIQKYAGLLPAGCVPQDGGGAVLRHAGMQLPQFSQRTGAAGTSRRKSEHFHRSTGRPFQNDNFFRITVTSFLDRYNFDMKSAQKECVHVLTPDLREDSLFHPILSPPYETPMIVKPSCSNPFNIFEQFF